MKYPYILEETIDYAVVFKPPKKHSVPLASSDAGQNTLLEWFAENRPSNALPDCGLINRLDFETHGLVLFAKNNISYEYFKFLQSRDGFIKEYTAVCSSPLSDDKSLMLPGFPPPPSLSTHVPSAEKPLIVMSYFRPYGPGRKEVRPVIDDKKKYHETAKDNGSFYRTEIVDIKNDIFTVRIKRGFRHQIRCHLYWIGFPIKNDKIYSYSVAQTDNSIAAGTLALCANKLEFTDQSGLKKTIELFGNFSFRTTSIEK